MRLSWLLYSFLGSLTGRLAFTCQVVNIKYENEPWCCGGADLMDGGGTGDGNHIGGHINQSRTTEDPEPIQDTTTVTPGPKPTVGNCTCGQLAHDSSSSDKILKQNVPWLVHIKIADKKNNSKITECSGSLINRRWLLTAAHCFCDSILECPEGSKGEQKEFSGSELESISMQIGTYSVEAKPTHVATKIIIHPDFYEERSNKTGIMTSFGGTDVALVKTVFSVFGEDAPSPVPNDDQVQPICLFPVSSAGEAMNNEADSIEDMDCHMFPGGGYHFPYHNTDDEEVLVCHPDTSSSALDSTSFITTALTREDKGNNSYSTNHPRCLTNTYGPPDGILKGCFSSCFLDKVDLTVHIHDNISVNGVFSNPSMAHPLCVRFRTALNENWTMEVTKEVAGSHMLPSGQLLHHEVNSLGWVKITDSEGETATCYTLESKTDLQMAISRHDYPFRYGWCQTCSDDDASCHLYHNSNWGWCNEYCSQPKEEQKIAHDMAVNAFSYEGCSQGLNSATEFCSGIPIIQSYGQNWNLTAEGNFTFHSHVLRKYRDDYKALLSNNTKGQRYAHNQHGGEICPGDAGGIVWKYQKVRADDSNERKHYVAIITGVVSRFEELCGKKSVDPTITSQPPMQSVHTRISAVLDWILENTGDQDSLCEEQRFGEETTKMNVA